MGCTGSRGARGHGATDATPAGASRKHKGEDVVARHFREARLPRTSELARARATVRDTHLRLLLDSVRVQMYFIVAGDQDYGIISRMQLARWLGSEGERRFVAELAQRGYAQTWDSENLYFSLSAANLPGTAVDTVTHEPGANPSLP